MKILPPILVSIAILFFGIYITGTLALYQIFPHLDSFMHFLGGATIGWWLFVYEARRNKRQPQLRNVFWAALLIGLAWEVAEFSSGAFLADTLIWKYFHGGGPTDTAYDVIFDISGALAVFALHSKRSHPLESSNS